MSINDARRFLKTITTDNELRDKLNKTNSHSEIITILQCASYDFSGEEINDAYRNLLISCQSEEQANMVKELKLWWDTLWFMTPE